MRNVRNLSRIKTAIRQAGVVVKNSPSINHPIAVTVFYRNRQDGTVSWFWPKGNRQTALSALYNDGSRTIKWMVAMYTVFLALGMEGVLAHGKLTVYADLPTATFLQTQCVVPSLQLLPDPVA